MSLDGKQGVSFYEPIYLPDGFFCLGHYYQSNERPLKGFVLVARVAAKIESHDSCNLNSNYIPPLVNPVDYSLMWCFDDGNDEIIAAEYLGDGVVKEPFCLQNVRELGPTIIYDSRTQPDKIIKILPVMVRHSVESIFNKLQLELYGEECPTRPKEENHWIGDERC